MDPAAQRPAGRRHRQAHRRDGRRRGALDRVGQVPHPWAEIEKAAKEGGGRRIAGRAERSSASSALADRGTVAHVNIVSSHPALHRDIGLPTNSGGVSSAACRRRHPSTLRSRPLQPPPVDPMPDFGPADLTGGPVPGNAPEDELSTRPEILDGVDDGRIVRISPDGQPRVVGETGGRPLGLAVARDGRLLVCDSPRGLLAMDTDSGNFETLVEEVDGRHLQFCLNVPKHLTAQSISPSRRVHSPIRTSRA